LYQIGDEITIEPTELVAGGAALARVNGFPIFVTNLYPGDIAVVRLRDVKKGFARADLVRLITAGALRRAGPCSIAEECGGCDWTALRLDAQLAAKRRILMESLRRVGKIESHPPIAVHPSPLNYRLRSRLHQEGDAIGFYAMESHRVVALAPDCEVVGVETAKHPRAGQTWEIDGQLISDERELMIHVHESSYRLSTSAFFQVNRHLLATMLRLAGGRAARVRAKRLAIDLYAGVGFFTLPLTKMFDRVIAVEGSDVSQKFARINAQRAEVVHESVESFAARMPAADLIFLDPPRAGAQRGVISAIGDRAREMICYLSCDPVTFSRDANRLIASGWRITSLDLLDLFPNTHHVETLASFERAE
jgi:tRNA/tmRNA/rRNA uracil-C5-methylase (TrmA/RlmC/RlmD family)